MYLYVYADISQCIDVKNIDAASNCQSKSPFCFLESKATILNEHRTYLVEKLPNKNQTQ